MPPALKPGDRVRIIAPASPFDRALFYRGIGWLAERYRVEIADGILARRGFLAGTDELRRRALDDALHSTEVAAIVAARGGYGALRIVQLANWAALRRHPKWIVGFSDVTALHVEAQRVGLCSMHAENAAGLGRGDDVGRKAWLDALEHPRRTRVFEGLTTVRGGRAQGPIVGGNLTVLFSAHAAGRLALPTEGILALEDVTESSYRIDRMLSALIGAGALDPIAAVVLGDFTDCPAGVHGVPVEDVLAERLGVLGVPVVSGLTFGHGRHNVPLPLGLLASLDATAGRLVIAPASDEPARR